MIRFFIEKVGGEYPGCGRRPWLVRPPNRNNGTGIFIF